MNICENGFVREMTAEELAAASAVPFTPVSYDRQASALCAVQLLLRGKSPVTADEHIRCGGLYDEWTAGSHAAGDIYTALEQVWECYQAYDNGVYPGIVPGSAAWYTFNRPMHGTTPDTARAFVQPSGSHDTYHAGEYAVYHDTLYVCRQDTAFSPEAYPDAWEAQSL